MKYAFVALAALGLPCVACACPKDVSYSVVHGHSEPKGARQAEGTIAVIEDGDSRPGGATRARLKYSESNRPDHGFAMDCASFLSNSSLTKNERGEERLELVMCGKYPLTSCLTIGVHRSRAYLLRLSSVEGSIINKQILNLK